MNKKAYKFPSTSTNVDSFLSERWSANADARYANDDRIIFELFQMGSRNVLSIIWRGWRWT